MADDVLSEARDAFRRHRWSEAYSKFSGNSVSPDDLQLLAHAAFLIGRADEAEDPLARAHAGYLESGNVEEAARCAFWLGFHLIQHGEHARGNGWLARAERVLEEVDCVVRGYLIVPLAIRTLAEGDADAAMRLFGSAAEIAARFDDADLLALGRLGLGRSLIRLGNRTEGIRLLDEVMVSVMAGDVSPVVVGVIYCAVISTCHEIFDLRRAQEWTAAFSRWCESEPDLVPFRGECLIYRAEILQARGEWSGALNEAQRAGEWLSQPPGQRSAGAAFYRQGEVHRLRGEYATADKAYREAERWGRSPQPGRALMQLAQGRTDLALLSIGQAMQGGPNRAVMLGAAVEIYLAAGDLEAARAAAGELSEMAGALEVPFLAALACQAEGEILLAEEEHQRALGAFRRALTTWRELGMPYEAARVQVRIARACRVLGDADSCRAELEDARRTFEKLNAGPDLAAIGDNRLPGGLTPREAEVLSLIATGMTNRAIADELYISEKTVARHVSNIFTKLGLSSRAAATAYAYEHGLAST